MPTFLLDHLAGCTPLISCVSCVAAKFLREKLSPADVVAFYEMVRSATAGESVSAVPASLDDSLDALEPIPYRLRASLANAGKETIRDLVTMTQAQALQIPNTGRLSIQRLETALARVGHRLGESISEESASAT